MCFVFGILHAQSCDKLHHCVKLVNIHCGGGRWAFSIWGLIFALEGLGVIYAAMPQGYNEGGWKERTVNAIGTSHNVAYMCLVHPLYFLASSTSALETLQPGRMYCILSFSVQEPEDDEQTVSLRILACKPLTYKVSQHISSVCRLQLASMLVV